MRMASEIEKDRLGNCSPESPHPVQVPECQTATIASTLSQDDLRPDKHDKLIRYTEQELLSLRPHAGDGPVATANMVVDKVPALDSVTEINPITGASAQDGLVPSPQKKVPRCTRQELLSSQPIAGDDVAAMANTSVNETPTFDSVTKIKSIGPKLPLMQSEPEQGTAVMADSNLGWGDTEIDEKNPDQTNAITQAEVKDNHGDSDHAESAAGKKKKKKKKKSSGKKKKPPPTGFEEFYADPPLTPQEHEEELNEIYHHSRSFVERIQQCVQRYRARRKLDSDRAHYFNKYLALGGVDTGMKAFNGGLDDDTLDTYNAKEIAEIQATDHIRSGTGNPKFYDASAPEHWVVDFEEVAKGFLSYRAPTYFGLETHRVKEYCGVIRNFLNYVLTHSVCPEYTTNILAAKKICDVAEKELPMIKEISRSFPGDFNMAASTLYGGRYKGLYAGNLLWPGEEETEGEIPQDQKRRISGMTISEAERIFKTAIVFVGTYDHFKAAMAENCYVVSVSQRHFEVTGICLPSQEMRMKFGGTKDGYGEVGNIKALGVLQVKHWDNPDAEPEDLTDDEESSPQAKDGHALPSTEIFWLEEDILEKCWVGMRFGATARELNIGIKYFDYISGVYPTFYTYLPAERLDNWKEPKLNTRGPPMVGDLEREEDDMDLEGNDY